MLAMLIISVLAALWLGPSVWTLRSSAQMASVAQSEKDRLQSEAARKQTQLEAQQAEARRLADEDRKRREVAILQALQKQKDAEAAANLAAAERMLAQQHTIHTDIARTSELQRSQKAQEQVALEDRRLADTTRMLEKERVRTASLTQAAVSQSAGQDQKLADTVSALPSAQAVKPVESSSPVHVASTAKVPATAKPATKSGKRSVHRTKVARPRGVARHSPSRRSDPAAQALADLCPLRWLDAALTDMHRRLSART
jgi:hypothetical protein